MGDSYEQNVNAVCANVNSSATNVTLAAARRGRRGVAIYNDSTAVLYLKFGATATTDSYTVQVPSGGYFETPFGYTGIIDGLWASVNGKARVTEVF
jgi:hypothetical protein